MKKGTKRLLFILLFSAVPMVTAQPISLSQGALPFVMGPSNPVLYGIASWYSETDPGINRHTANGEVFSDKKLTCATWDFPFNTRLRVTNLKNQMSVVCRVNDRGPAKRLNRVIDLTKTAFTKIASPRRGLIDVSVEEI